MGGVLSSLLVGNVGRCNATGQISYRPLFRLEHIHNAEIITRLTARKD